MTAESSGRQWAYNGKNVVYSINSERSDRTDKAEPGIALLNDASFGSQHPGGANFIFGDAHVAFLSEDIDLKGVYYALASRKAGELISGDF